MINQKFNHYVLDTNVYNKLEEINQNLKILIELLTKKSRS